MKQNQQEYSIDSALEWIKKNLENLKFGSIQITVHEGHIVQIDKTIKYRGRIK